MDRFEEGLEKLQEIKGEVKDRIKIVKSQLNEENETSEVEEKFLSIGEKLGAWGKFAGWGDKLKANAEVSAMSFGVLTLSTAFNAAFLANNIIEMQRINEKLLLANRLAMTTKWRADHDLLSHFSNLGYKFLMSSDQRFYMVDTFPESFISASKIGEHEKILICSGTYKHKGPLNLSNTRHIIAEPGTKIIIYLDSFYDEVFINNQRDLKIENLTVQVEKARGRIIDDIKIYLSHFWDVHQLGWKPKFLKETDISYENFTISYPCLRHWFGGIFTICASTLGLGVISSLRQRGYTAPKLMMLVLISAGALSGSAFRKYKTGDRRKYFYQPEIQF